MQRVYPILLPLEEEVVGRGSRKRHTPSRQGQEEVEQEASSRKVPHILGTMLVTPSRRSSRGLLPRDTDCVTPKGKGEGLGSTRIIGKMIVVDG